MHFSPAHPHHRLGFTLIELAIVVALLAMVATFAVSRLSGVTRHAKDTLAAAEMETLRDALLGPHSIVADYTGIPGFSPAYLRLANLLSPTNLVGTGDRWLDDDTRRGSDAGFATSLGAINPNPLYADFATFTNRDEFASRGWQGPYLKRIRPIENTDSFRTDEFPKADDRRSALDETFADRGFFPFSTRTYSPYGIPGEQAIGDPWGNPYVLQIPPAEAFETPSSTSETERFRYARIVSAGPDGILSTPCYHPHSSEERRAARLAGRTHTDTSLRGDDLVLFLQRADLYEDTP